MAAEVAGSIGSQHTTLEMDDERGSWDSVTETLRGLGQPFADTSIFAVMRVSHAMRRHVTVGLSGDGGDEGFGGYDLYWQLERIARLLRFPRVAWRGGAALSRPLAAAGLVRPTLSRRALDLAGGDDVTVMQTLFSWLRSGEQADLLVDPGAVDPAARLFERRWGGTAAWGTSRVERLSAHAVELNVRLLLPDDYLFKVDAGSMRASLEVRVPLLDEAIVDFGLSLPHRLRTDGRRGKRVLRALAARRLPPSLAIAAQAGVHGALRPLGRRAVQGDGARRPAGRRKPRRRALPPRGLRPLGRGVRDGSAGRGDLPGRALPARDDAPRPRRDAPALRAGNA